VQVDFPQGIKDFPTDVITVKESGPGHMCYVGWNKCLVPPVRPGSPVRYSIFLCPTQQGNDTVSVEFALTGGGKKTVPFDFKIKPAACYFAGYGGAGSGLYYAEKEKGDGAASPEAEATIIVTLPQDAKLTIDDEPTESTSGTRVFTTPSLPPGKNYYYTLKAEVVRDGKPIKAEQVVTVKAGQTMPVTLTLPSPGIAQR
jgi:uncharacterized protein (TIGR03000 family)